MGGFVGIGDAVYNAADPRWKKAREQAGGSLQLPRLAFDA